jgi:mlo protein
MGSRMKKSIFDEQTSKALKKWHNTVKKKKRLKLGKSSVRTMDGSKTDSTMHYPSPILHHYKTTGYSTYGDDQDDYQSDIELSSTSPTSNLLVVRVDPIEQDAKENEHQTVVETIQQQPTIRGSYSFVKLDHVEKSAD